MSYDFMLMRLQPTPAPGPIGADLAADAHQPIADAVALHEAVRGSALFTPGSIRFDSDLLLTWRTPDGGQVGVNVIAGCISLRMHAHWSHAAQLFDLARGLWPDLVLFDLQQGLMHDPASFQAAIERNDSEKARRAAGDGDA
jgi:hypothetical protein